MLPKLASVTTVSTGVSLTNLTLTIDTSSAMFKSIYILAYAYPATNKAVDKILLTVCGDQVITNDDPTNAVFAISGSKTTNSVWVDYSLENIWSTASTVLPTNECPISEIKVCEDSACATELTSASGLRITEANGVFTLGVDKGVVEAEP